MTKSDLRIKKIVLLKFWKSRKNMIINHDVLAAFWSGLIAVRSFAKTCCNKFATNSGNQIVTSDGIYCSDIVIM